MSTETSANPTAIKTSRNAASIGTALSTLTLSTASPGRLDCIRATSSRAPRAMSSVLPFDCASTCSMIARAPVQARVRPLVLRCNLNLGHLSEAHEVAARAAGDHEIAEILLSLEAHHRAQRKFPRARLEPPGGELHVFAAQRVLDIGHGQLPRGKRLAVNPDPHRIAPAAVDAHARNARNRRKPIDEIALGVVRELEHRHRFGAERDGHDGIGAGVSLHDLRRIGFGRQPARDTRNAIPHVVGRRVDVAIHVELDPDLGPLVRAVGLDLENALDAGYRVLDGLRDLRFDDRGRRARCSSS